MSDFLLSECQLNTRGLLYFLISILRIKVVKKTIICQCLHKHFISLLNEAFN